MYDDEDPEEATISVHLNGPEGSMELEMTDGHRRRAFMLTMDEQRLVLRLIEAIYARDRVR